MCRIAPCSTAATGTGVLAPFVSSLMKVEPAWIDYNGHLNMAYYNVLFDRAVDEVFELLGCGADYVKKGFSTFTAEVHVRYLRELKEGDRCGSPSSCSITTRSACTISSSFFTRGGLGVGDFGEHVAACRHGGKKDGAVPDRGDAAADPDEGRARPVAAAGSSRTARGHA